MTTVRPGEVITSELMNSILGKLQEFEQRIQTLETGGTGPTQPLITSFDPPAQIEVGRELTIKGKFDFPPALNSVTIDNVRITTFRPGSNDAQLIFIVPTSITVPAGGSRSVRVRVSNSMGQDQKSYLLLPFVPSTVPAPKITAVTNVGDNSTLLRTSEPARITGENFATNPAENIIRFKFQMGGQTIAYPKPGQTLAINTEQSGPTQIVVTVPDIVEIGIGVAASITLEVGVGTALPDVFPVTVIRLTAA